jgi:hypothetical protein
MVISHSKQFIFIHNYKAAGNSIRTAFQAYVEDRQKPNFVERVAIAAHLLPRHYPNLYPWHLTAKEARDALKGTGTFESYFKFGFVRDPWDLQVSLYTFMRQTRSHTQHRLVSGMKNFDEYLEWRVNKDLHFQKDIFCDQEGTLLVDYVGKLERIEEDFNHISLRLGIEPVLPHKNSSNRERDYLAYYTPKSVDLVFEAFQKDIQAFGYSKPIMN